MHSVTDRQMTIWLLADHTEYLLHHNVCSNFYNGLEFIALGCRYLCVISVVV